MKLPEQTAERVIIGIDPGTVVMGYGVLIVRGRTTALVTMGVLNLDRYENHYLRLHRIYQKVLALMDEYHPDEMAIEAPFFGKNVQSMLKLGRAQGAAIAAALNREIPIFEYAPLKIKMAITAAYCHYMQTTRPMPGKAYAGWKDFIAKNPGKVRGL